MNPIRAISSALGLAAVLAAFAPAQAQDPAKPPAKPPAPAGEPAPPAAEGSKEEAIRESVVKIYATMRGPDLVRPWQKQSPRRRSGTGVVIEGKRILTNAHVISYASQVFVEPNQSGEKIAATVEYVAPGIDLAVLKLEDEAFFEKRPPLPRAEKLPEIKESVIVYGYPTGGAASRSPRGSSRGSSSSLRRAHRGAPDPDRRGGQPGQLAAARRWSTTR